MLIELQNETVLCTVSTLGAELQSFVMKETDQEYIWQGDSTYWSGRSPVLFPIIGSLNGGSISVDGSKYAMGNHGFARKSEFICTEQEAHTATFILEENDTTLSQYPFPFRLSLTYTLIGTALSISYKVTNTGSKIMPFSLGTHPAFNCPMGTTDRLEQWHLIFDKKETLSRIGLKDNLLDIDSLTPWMDNEEHLTLKPEDFYSGAIVYKNIESSHITLESNHTREKVTVSFNNLPDLGIWQPKDAPFLCIEPWQGHGDPVAFKGDITEKMGMIHLNPKDSFEAELRIRIE